MKELKRLRIKFIVSNMAMVMLVIGLAFLTVGYVTKTRVEQANEQIMERIYSAHIQVC